MYELVGYYLGPIEKSTSFQKLRGKIGSIVFQINSQLYSENLPTPLLNLGIVELSFKPEEVPQSKDDLEERLRAELSVGIRQGISRDTLTIPADQIIIRVEPYKE